VAQILQLYTERWTIEVFFRQSKMQLELDRYQVRELPAKTANLCALRKSARMEIKREVVSRVYSQALCGVPLSDINQELGIG
jgi:hypothetical protein